jgi:hypothetical protein
MAVESCAFLQDAAHWLNDFYVSMSWSGLRDWISSLATAAGAITAFCALSTWRQQINLQDRYQKVDALLNSYVLCLRAGHDWQWEGGIGENRDLKDSSEKSHIWREALMVYRKDWIMALHLIGEESGKDLSINPEKLQRAVIDCGKSLYSHSSITMFFQKMENIMEDGASEIHAIRKGK